MQLFKNLLILNFIRKGTTMKKTSIFIIISLIFICNLSYAKSNKYFEIVDNGQQEITFEPIIVDAGSIEEQMVVVENTDDKKYSGVIAYAIDSEVPNDYKKMLPYETYVNPNFHIRYEIGYSPSNHTIVIVRRLETEVMLKIGMQTRKL
ncbi:hypothetical protein BROSI_A0853 [Candidatus Brocadia sinica JPN1]|uniref:Uncharacterized protein n=1 Tax=Candidatus Brocadia sinica JPN1 TaxID=1197129 RepID=A0ABQ0JUH1_9BACT|nr:hypothetical protein BROSI_A0853 [Candidatus Brocadia sinica JPN1]